ncbi:MAG: tetratricopeptide repeat protein [Planctomycetia bacterium]
MTHFRSMVVVVAILCSSSSAMAQSGGKKSAAAARSLDATAQKLETDFLSGASELASSYEEAGDKDKAKAMLQAILRLRPDAESIKEKLKELEESVFKDRQEVMDLDMSKGWIPTSMTIEKGKKVRLEAIGSYKLLVNDSLGPEGYRSDDGEMLVSDAPVGALIGIVVAPGGNPSQAKAQGRQPFLVGEKKEITPRDSGLLVLRVNAPPGAKCVGRLKVRISGNFAEASK